MKKGNQVVNWLLLVGLSMMWGFSFFFIKRGLESFIPLEVGALRIFIAFCTLLPFLLFFHKKIPLKAVAYTGLAGLLGSGLPPILFSYGQTHVSTSITGILNTTTPLFALIFGVLLFGVKAKWNQFIGVIIGFSGAATIILTQSDIDFNFDPKYALLIVLATSCYGMSANILKSKVMIYDIHPIQISIFGFIFMGPVAAAFLAWNGTFERILHDPNAQVGIQYLLILGIFGTAIAMFFFNWLTQRTSALFASFTTYLIPIFAVLIGIFILGEAVRVSHVIGFAIILTGVIIANKK
ncbi:MAG TPA: DMT family transporter [Chitinophagales bacterium]|nr:DMT family transporter [Chitinophagales bacterium]